MLRHYLIAALRHFVRHKLCTDSANLYRLELTYLRHWLDGYAYRVALNPVYFVTPEPWRC